MRRIILFSVLLTGALFAGIQSASAAAPGTVVLPGTINFLGYVVDTATAISFLIGTVLPAVAAFFIKSTWSPFIKMIIHLFLAAITAVATQAVATINGNTPFLWQSVSVSALITFAIGVLTYKAGLKEPVAANIQVKYGIRNKTVS